MGDDSYTEDTAIREVLGIEVKAMQA
jgi:hypothetical protein